MARLCEEVSRCTLVVNDKIACDKCICEKKNTDKKVRNVYVINKHLSHKSGNCWLSFSLSRCPCFHPLGGCSAVHGVVSGTTENHSVILKFSTELKSSHVLHLSAKKKKNL